MKRAFLFLLPFISVFISCTFQQNEKLEIITGNLEDITTEVFTLHKDIYSPNINISQVLKTDNEEFILSRTGQKIQFYDSQSGKKKKEIAIDKNGPHSLKGGISAFLAISPDTLILASQTGTLALYLEQQKLKEVNFNLPFKGMFFIEGKHGNMFRESKDAYHFAVQPLDAFKGEDKTPTGYRDWFMSVNIETGEQRPIQFDPPGGYEKFLGDVLAVKPKVTRDPIRNRDLVTFPFSDTLMIFNNGIKVENTLLETNQKFDYQPSQKKEWDNFVVFVQPKEASAQITFIHDPYRDLFLRIMKINESGDSDSKFERTKHYALNIYSPDFTLLSEHLFDFKGRDDISNWFVTSKGLYINLPEQESDDYYQFYHVSIDKAIGKL